MYSVTLVFYLQKVLIPLLVSSLLRLFFPSLPSSNCHTADVIFEMVQTCFRMTVQTRLSELLRRCAESTLVEMVIYIFSNYNMQNPPGMFYFIFKSITSIILFVIILYYHSSLTNFFFSFSFSFSFRTHNIIQHSSLNFPNTRIRYQY